MATVRERIVQLLKEHPEGLDDDEITARLGLKRRQQANACCRQLELQGHIERRRVGRKVRNFWKVAPSPERAKPRKATVARQTAEVSVKVELDLDGHGEGQFHTGLLFFDHLLAQLARHGLFDITISATGQDQHHLVEDVGLCLGRALSQALGDKGGIVRFGWALVPMDEALAQVAVDLGGRGYALVEAPLGDIEGLRGDLVRHFLDTLAREGRFNLHAQVLRGLNDHHKAEALFKALARALGTASRPEPRLEGKTPSTKGLID